MTTMTRWIWVLSLALALLVVPLGADAKKKKRSKKKAAEATEVVETGALEVGQTYHGFELVQRVEIPEIHAEGLRFLHTQSGAQLVKYVAADDNKSFCITFETPPNGDFGIPHILEHSVLEGSKKFPVKSPFMVLARGSLNTFLNAMTSSDFTMYPVASTNETDFFNLVDVYLDAVFHPRIHDEERVFLQEGWRYELADVEAPLEYNGVVYNEMKGAYSSPGRILDYVVTRELFPDIPYGYSSGGYPDAIPELTWYELKEYHAKHYHPSNAMITLWGDGDTLKELQFIHENYLAEYYRQDKDLGMPLQALFDAPKTVEATYPVGEDEDTTDKTYLSLAWVASGAAEPAESMALTVLADVLINRPGTPLRKALEEAGVGKEMYAYYDDTQQGTFSINVEGANPDDAERFVEIVEQTMTQLAADGLDKRVIEGVINRHEFMLREADYGSFPPGLVYTYFGTRAWMFADDPFLGVFYEAPLATVRKALEEPYLEGLMTTLLLENTHRVTAVVSPEPGLETRTTAEREQKLAGIKAALSAEEVEAIVAQTADLKAWQTLPDSPEALATIPMLSRDELDVDQAAYPVAEKTVDGTRVLHFEYPTNGIVYLRLMFDARVVAEEDLQTLSLLTDVLGELDTENYSYGDLDTEMGIHTGGIGTGLSSYQRLDDKAALQPKVVVHGKALLPKLPQLLELSQEVTLRTKFDDAERLGQVLAMVDAQYEDAARSSGHTLAVGRLHSYLSRDGAYSEQINGLAYTQHLSQLHDDYEARSEQQRADLAAVAAQVFSRDNLVVAVTCSAGDYAAFEKQLPTLLEALPAPGGEIQEWAFEGATPNEGLTSASKVQYVVRGADYGKLGHSYSGRLDLLDKILSRDYLYENIRVHGGAYGAWSSFDREGYAYFASYRDPQLTQTLDVYAGAADYIENLELSDEEMTRYVIGVIADRDQPLSPAALGGWAVSSHMRGITREMRQAERSEILSATPDDIRALAPLIRAVLDNSVLCVYGNEELLKEHEELFEALVPVLE